MALRVVSTKLTEEEHYKVLEICKKTDCSLSTFVKECVADMIKKESHKNETPIDETINAPEFSSDNNGKKPKEDIIAPKIRYQYF